MSAEKQQNENSVSTAISEEKIKEIENVSQKLFGKIPDRVAFPGGKSRDAFVADLDGQICVFAKRESEDSAILEARVLKAFSSTGNAPKFLARSGNWVVQECVPGIRLPIVLDQTVDMVKREQLVSDALKALLGLHEAARVSGLQHSLKKIGASSSWIEKQLSQGDVISENLEIEKPVFSRSAVADIMNVKHADFVKRDARPGNAMIFEGKPYWFDFEDCGRRRALDDLIWVVCDEWTAIDEEAEDRIIEMFLPLFGKSHKEIESARYLCIYGVIHMMWRMRLIVKYYLEDGVWWDRDICLSKDKVGVTKSEAGRLLWRMQRWTKRDPLFEELLPWIDALRAKLDLNLSANLPSFKKTRHKTLNP